MKKSPALIRKYCGQTVDGIAVGNAATENRSHPSKWNRTKYFMITKIPENAPVSNNVKLFRCGDTVQRRLLVTTD